MTTDDPSSRPDALGNPPRATSPAVEPALVAITAVAIVAGVVLRFWPRTSLWLDEALTVNISTLSLGEIPGALRRDGHPPLFYFLLHLWTQVGGTSDWWVRALSGVIGVATIPLAYLAGRRIASRRGAGPLGVTRTGLITAAVMSILPYGIRYGSETRQYALTIALVTGGYLLVDDLLSGRAVGSRRIALAAGTAVVTGALLWSHYWSMWLLAVVGVLAVLQAVRARTEEGRVGARYLIGALIIGGVLFLPWVPTLLYQTAHTGTPWGKAYGVVEVITETIRDFSGDALTSYATVSLILLALAASIVAGRTGSVPSEGEVMLSASLQPRIRVEAGVLVATMCVGWLTAAVSGNTYASRYAAVVFPLFVLCVAAGIAVTRQTRSTVAALALLVLLCLYGSFGAISQDRTQAGQVGDRIVAAVAESPDPAQHVVVSCPDQIGVALQRVLDSNDAGVEVIPYPAAGNPRFVDWVDYADRNAAADPRAFVDGLAERISPETTVYVVAMPGYNTFGTQCEELVNLLSVGRPTLEVIDPAETGESMGLWIFGPIP